MEGLEDCGGVECVSLAQIVQAKDALLKLSAVAEEQNECVAAVAEGDAVTEGLTFDTTLALKGALGVLRQSASSTERLIFRLEKRVADLQTNYDAHQVSCTSTCFSLLAKDWLPCRLICCYNNDTVLTHIIILTVILNVYFSSTARPHQPPP